MKRFAPHFIALTLACLASIPVKAQLTLDGCIAKAESNYPVIKKYGIAEKISAIDLSDIDKSWLPQATVYLQGTAQNAVPQFPDALRGVLENMGQDFRGLGKLQYKAGIDINQTLWDGGTSKSRRETARAALTEQKAAIDVEMYAIRERVESVYFAILLIQEQTEQIAATVRLLDSNLEEMKAMKKNGAAMQSDVDMVEAQKLTAAQQLAAAEGNAAQYRRLLAVLTGEPTEGKTLSRPDGTMPADTSSDRPELHLFDARKNRNDTRLPAIKASLMPKIGLFAQAAYGYPGFDYFSAMRNRDMKFNILAGIKMSWNVGSLYTRRNDIDRTTLANLSMETDREKFTFETELATAGQLSEIETMRKVMAEDDRIVGLRSGVRKAAESQLRNGVIDATALLSKITDEEQARLTATYHEVQLLRLIYQYRNTINR